MPSRRQSWQSIPVNRPIECCASGMRVIRRRETERFESALDAPALARTAAVVRQRSDVLDREDAETRRLEGADRALAARAGAFDLHVDLLHAELQRGGRGLLGGALRGERRALARAGVADRSG